MLFDITNYNQYVLFFSLIFFLGGGVYLFRSNYVSIIDPITMHLIWMAGHLAFLCGYMFKNGVSMLPAFFFLNMLLYTFVYKFFLKRNTIKLFSRKKADDLFKKINRIKIIFIVLLILNIISKINFFKFILSNPDVSSWFMYRFTDMQGRDPLFRILATSSIIFLLFYTFLLFAVMKRWRYFVVIAYGSIIALEVVAGGRSILIGVIFSLGLGIFYFSDYFKITEIKKFTNRSLFFVMLAVLAAILVTSFYSSDYSVKDGFSIVTNRFLAAGDGLEYYMNYDGLHKIKSGLGEYIYSIFGIYIKRFTGEEYKNVGLQLSELVLGELEFTQGSNYTFLLQTMVLGYQFFFIYVPIIAYLSAKLRTVKFKSISFLPLSFFLSSTSYVLSEDIEYWVLLMISGLLVFYFVIYPINKFTFK
ncbi:hypothetical protein EV200_10310 [Pedobacter psychrotolerans]|uniref:Oligosaccharide repeat unit polymerase n=1 Tax=Pedobacter psychrotolerans TaxID=1843235 RepID=A0A4R2HEJ8_9SPHI|nr:O-antigen polymerase [Pedobacter psychrotolerans]TCO26680.1 hypothetical protein EV200_10310 [Pedobacter psychrotolerans]GGE55684.1 hypothetical protein GCM10011413_22540 [Pedobacter psychrotolerans]